MNVTYNMECQEQFGPPFAIVLDSFIYQYFEVGDSFR